MRNRLVTVKISRLLILLVVASVLLGAIFYRIIPTAGKCFDKDGIWDDKLKKCYCETDKAKELCGIPIDKED